MEIGIAGNVTLPVIRRFAVRGIGLIRSGQERRVVAERIGRLNLTVANTRQPLKHLSGGNQQKALIAKWELSDARIFIFDEPTVGVDVGAKQEIFGLISELAERGAGIVLISSELEEVVGLCDRVLVMREGRCVGELEGDDITEPEILRLCFDA